MREWIKQHQFASGIFASAVFMVFFEPPLQWLMTATPKWLGRLGLSLVNQVFKQAARSSLYSLVISLMLVIIIGVASYNTFEILQIIKSIKQRLVETEALLNPKKAPLDSVKQPQIEYNHDIALEQLRATDKKLYRFSIRTVVVMVFFYTWAGIYVIAPHTLKAEFDKTINIIKPYTSAQTINLLESNWVQMQDYSDFEEINAILLDIKSKHNILP